MASTSAGACSQQMDWTEWPVVLASSSAAASSHCGSASTDRCCSQQSGRSGWPADWLTGPRWARTYRESGPVDKMLTHETTTSDNSTSAHTPRHSLTHPRHAIASASHHIHYSYKGVFIATQLNSTDPVEQRTAKSVVFLFMTSRPTNWVNCCSHCRAEFSWVELCRYEHPFTRPRS